MSNEDYHLSERLVKNIATWSDSHSSGLGIKL